MGKRQCVDLMLDERGIRRVWFAEQLGISPSYLTLLLQEKRGWTEKLKTEAERILMVPRTILFFEEHYRRADDNGQPSDILKGADPQSEEERA